MPHCFVAWLRCAAKWNACCCAASGNRQIQGMCQELYDHRQWLWTFLRHEGVEPTNNASERRCVMRSSGGSCRLAHRASAAVALWRRCSRLSKPVANSTAMSLLSSPPQSKLISPDNPRPYSSPPGERLRQPLPSALKPYIATKGNWSDQQWREYLWVYYRPTEIADGEVGRVLTALEKTGLAGNTVVVFTSDHGEMMGSHQMITKQKLYEEAAAVPVIVAPLGGAAGLDHQHLISGLDIMPTLLDYAGVDLPATAEGKSLRPLVEGKTVPWRNFLVSEVNGISESRMVRTARYKYIVYPTGDNREQFFDEQQDPGELNNLIAEPSLAGEVATASQPFGPMAKRDPR